MTSPATALADLPLRFAADLLHGQTAIALGARAAAAQTRDAAEGIAAFRARRSPAWTGR